MIAYAIYYIIRPNAHVRETAGNNRDVSFRELNVQAKFYGSSILYVHSRRGVTTRVTPNEVLKEHSLSNAYMQSILARVQITPVS